MRSKNEITVVQFDEIKAKEVLKTCPKIVRDYVKLLQHHWDMQKDITQKAISKLRLTDKELQGIKAKLSQAENEEYQ